MPEEIDQGSSEGTVETESTVDSSSQVSDTGQQLLNAALTETSQPVDLKEVSELAAGVLKGVPSHLLPTLAPFVKEWDKNYQGSLAKVKASYADFEGIDPVTAKEAINLQQLIIKDPKSAIRIISEMNADETEDNDDSDDNNVSEEEEILKSLPPSIRAKLEKIDALDSVVSTIAKAEMARIEEAQLVEARKTYSTILADLAEKHGSFDEDFVNLHVANGEVPEDAVKKYHAMADKIASEKLSAHNKAPKVIGGSGEVLFSEGTPPAKLSDKERKNLVAKMLRAGQD